mmetsp:Transcript_98966/g.171491  ORF Transcript_98966/g.171491 Transcript_98966/m.171491 type:complete len:263 (-) Transcript_98966:106-894(-)
MSADAGTNGSAPAAAAPAGAAQKKDDPLAPVKAALDSQMRRPPYERFSRDYDGEHFARATYNALVPWGRDQTFTGLTQGTPMGAHTPHGWGILEHHEGITQACAMWLDGVASGPGMWLNVAAGREQCGYGTWVDGKRDGYFALVKEGNTYIEEYDFGELKRRIKWRRDKLHTKCVRCNSLFVPSANTPAEKFCRFHSQKPDHEGRFQCCGALLEVNPRGCCTSMHVDPAELDATGCPPCIGSVEEGVASLNLGAGSRADGGP